MRSCLLGLILLVAACSKAPDGDQAQSYDAAGPAAMDTGGPDVNITAAPGVAFNYRYAFRLPASNIGKAQEVHATACEKLGVARCRITGMRYTLDRDNQIDASLAFKLDPALARRFGREGIAAIERAEGMLVDAEITGTDVGEEIDRLDASKAAIGDERARIERELARPKLSAAARTELLLQRSALEEQGRATEAAKGDRQAMLANTPMTFTYESGQAIRGFDPRSPFADAADTGIASAQWTLAVTMGAIALLAPPALVLLLLFLAWHRLRPLTRRLRNRDATGA